MIDDELPNPFGTSVNLEHNLGGMDLLPTAGFLIGVPDGRQVLLELVINRDAGYVIVDKNRLKNDLNALVVLVPQWIGDHIALARDHFVDPFMQGIFSGLAGINAKSAQHEDNGKDHDDDACRLGLPLYRGEPLYAQTGASPASSP